MEFLFLGSVRTLTIWESPDFFPGQYVVRLDNLLKSLKKLFYQHTPCRMALL